MFTVTKQTTSERLMSTNAVSAASNAPGWQGGLKSALRGPWVNVALVAGLAVALGLLLPKILPGDTVIDKDRPKPDAKSSSPTEYKAPTLPDVPNPQALLGQLFMGTILVLGLSVVSIWVMRRWLGGQGFAHTAGGEMRLVETLRLGQRTSLHLVHLGKREILIGADAGGIKSIVPLARPFDDALAETEGNDAVASPTSNS
jgi:flagellar biogenesis protein FliO